MPPLIKPSTRNFYRMHGEQVRGLANTAPSGYSVTVDGATCRQCGACARVLRRDEGKGVSLDVVGLASGDV